MKKHSELQEGVTLYRAYNSISKQIQDTKELLNDLEMKEIAEQEIEVLNTNLEKIEEQLKVFLLPKDPNDNKNAILEIRSGTGGEEAALFAASLFRMYTKFAEQNSWKVEIMSQNVMNQNYLIRRLRQTHRNSALKEQILIYIIRKPVNRNSGINYLSRII